ncbi:MAG: glycosyltransferase family 4 protein [Candidatus Omnitrophica bacterium]|nr:glycosyltransferase family 4 protein [Candidatus Omnitrophota bacterium]
MKRILLVCTGLNDLGGANTHLASLYRELSSRYAVTLVLCSSVENELRTALRRAGIAANDVLFIPRYKKRLIFPLVAALAGVFRDLQPQVVHSFHLQSDIFCGCAAKIARVPSLFSYFESRPLVENTGWLKKYFYRVMNAVVKKEFSATVAVSAGIKKELVDGQWRDADKITVIYLGVKLPVQVEEMDAGRFAAGRLRIGTIGRLSPEKGLDRAIRAFALASAALGQAELIIWGEGTARPDLLKLCRDLNIEAKVHFYGWARQPRQALADLDIFLMPSLREGCPTALLEALSLKRPVIASDIPGINEIIINGQNGLLADTADADQFAAAITVLAQNFSRAQALGEAGYQTVLRKFMVQQEMDQLTALYESGCHEDFGRA